MDCPRKTPEENTDDEVGNIQGVVYDEQILKFVTLVLLLTLLHLKSNAPCESN